MLELDWETCPLSHLCHLAFLYLSDFPTLMIFGNGYVIRERTHCMRPTATKVDADMRGEGVLGKELICYLKQISASMLQHRGIKKKLPGFLSRDQKYLDVNQIYYHIIIGVFKHAVRK